MKRIGQRNEDRLALPPDNKLTGGRVGPCRHRATGPRDLTRSDHGGQADQGPLQLSGLGGRVHAQIGSNQALDFISCPAALPQPSGLFRSTTAQV